MTVPSGKEVKEYDEDESPTKYDNAHLEKLNSQSDGPTLLWSRPAQLVSAVTGLASFSVRAGSKVGGWGVAVGRESTLKFLELNRAVLEAVLVAAGKDVSQRSGGELGRAEAEGILERSIHALHSGISSISFFAATGFYVTQASIDQVSSMSVQSLAFLNAIFGCTESSRAVAAILALIKAELNKPGAGPVDEAISTSDLFIGVAGFLYLQRIGRRQTEIEFRESGGEETIWDVVIDDRGFRADVVGTRKKNIITASNAIAQTPLPVDLNEVEAIEKDMEGEHPTVALSADDATRLSDEEVRDRIMSQLPTGARATITSETLTLKTVKVDIHDGETAYIEAPPGLTMVSESLSHNIDLSSDERPHQTIIFRTASKRSSSAQVSPFNRTNLPSSDNADVDRADADDPVTMRFAPTRSRRSVEYGSKNKRHSEQQSEEAYFASGMADHSGPVANQKKSRIPPTETTPPACSKQSKLPLPKLKSETGPGSGKGEKSGVIKKALKSLSPNQSTTMLNRTTPGSASHRQAGFNIPSPLVTHGARSFKRNHAPTRIYPMPTMQVTSPAASPDRLTPPNKEGSYFTVHEQRHESTYSHTDSYSLHSTESRPASPTLARTHARTTSGLSKTKSHTEISIEESQTSQPTQGTPHHIRSRSLVPSLYSMATKNSEEAIILAPKTPVPRRSIFEDSKMLTALATDGKVPGTFPNRHLVLTARRFARFASASYGSNFLRFMGLSSTEENLSNSTELMTLGVHHEHSSFSSYTGLPTETIVLSSFLDPKGVSNNSRTSPESISPLIHFVSIDRESKAIVLTCRGTLGFEDLLTDMTCDYDDMYWQGQPYKVHKGIYKSARRLLEGSGGNRIIATIKSSLEEFPDFGLVLCGHSLGGAVAALLAILISEPSSSEPGQSDKTSFVTASMPKLLAAKAHTEYSTYSPPVILPSGRPIHVYSYGTPAIVSPSLRLATRGLITTIVTANDIFPSLSLGTLHDFRAVARHLKSDIGSTIEQLRTRMWDRIWKAIYASVWPEKDERNNGFPPPPSNLAGDGLGEDNWAWDELRRMRKLMTSEKLVPAGEVFVLETTRVFDRLEDTADTEGSASTKIGETSEDRYYRALGRPATRVQFKLIRDVDIRFKELRFGRHMFNDHSPGRYEAGLAALEQGCFE